jgi:hypothetical protein
MKQQGNWLQAISTGICQHSRMALAGTTVITFLAVGFGQIANANLSQDIKSLNSPQLQMVVTLGCGEDINPTCHPTAVSTLKFKFTGHFYIDGKDLGPANKLYKEVCTEYRLSKGYHSARVYARDTSGNTADTGTIKQAIKCAQTNGIEPFA